MADSDQRTLYRRALAEATEFVEQVTPGDLGRASVCRGWTIGDLLAHMVGENAGFAAAVRDGTAPADAYAPVPFTLDGWNQSVRDLVSAFDGSDLDGTAVQVAFHPTKPLPIRVLLGAQLLDTAVHSWDVARSLGGDYTPDAELAAAVLAIAEPIPDGENREGDNPFFAHAVALDGGSDWERALAILGRDPQR